MKEQSRQYHAETIGCIGRGLDGRVRHDHEVILGAAQGLDIQGNPWEIYLTIGTPLQ